MILAVGVLSALGERHPVRPRCMYLIPGVSSERLLNRNLLLVDLSLAVLVAWWVHLLLASRTAGPTARGRPAGRPAPPGPGGGAGRPRRWSLTCLPVALMAVVCVLLWATPGRLGRLPRDPDHPSTPSALRGLAVLVTAELAIAGAATWVVLVARAVRSPATLPALLAVVLVVDLALFNVLVSTRPSPRPPPRPAGPGPAVLARSIGDGRFIIYDPDQFDDDQL